jgi:hypothetical protein
MKVRIRLFQTLAASLLVALATSSSYGDALLQVDFGSRLPNSPLQPGFQGMWGTNDHPTSATFGPYTVELHADSSMTGTQSSRGFFDKLSGFGGRIDNVDASFRNFYTDFFFNRSTINGEGIDLKVSGLTPNLPYTLTVLSYDADASPTVPTRQEWGPQAGSNTTGTSTAIDMLRTTPDPGFEFPSQLWQAEWTGSMQVSTTTGTLDIFGTTSAGSRGTVLNGFKLNDGTNDVLVLDLGEGASANVQPGFHHISGGHFDADGASDGTSQAVGAYTVSVQRMGGAPGDTGFYNEYAIRMGGEIPRPAAHNLFRDCFCNISSTEGNGILLTIDGVTPNTEYDLRIYDMDPAAGATTINRWGPSSSGNTTGDTATIDLERAPPPQSTESPDHYVTIRVQATDTTLEVFGTTVDGTGFGGVRLNGFELFAVESNLEGDFNLDGNVDAADYVMWRKNDNSPGTYTQWTTNFGASSGTGGGNGAVPEPTSASSILLLTLTVAAALRRRP